MPLQLNDNLLSPTYLGLSSLDADVRTKEYGNNIRPKRPQKNHFARLWGIVSEPMLLLLIATTILYYFIGSHLETIVFGLSVIPIVLIQFFQEIKTDKAIKILDTLLVEISQVYRDGVLIKLPSGELVPGDLVYLSAGDKVPADGVLTRSPGLMVDEAVLTGESMSVVKSNYHKANDEAGELFQGTMVVQGDGYMVVLATGGETHYGKLGNLLEKIVEEVTPLQRKINSLVRKLAIVAVLFSLFVGAIISQTQGLIRGLLGALTIAMSVIPEEFPVVFSVFLIMGVWRLSKRKALVRKMVMVESLGSVTVICSDKTGTLTEGKMSLQKIFLLNELIDLQAQEMPRSKIIPLIESAMLALERVAVDPIEIEVQRFVKAERLLPLDIYKQFELKTKQSFNAETKLVHHIWQARDGKMYQYTAGAPESVVEASNLSASEKKAVTAMYQKLSSESYRIVAVAKTLVTTDQDFLTQGFEFCGLLAMSDPPREGVKEAVSVCRAAGMRVIMITGDHALTAKAVARRVGIEMKEAVIEGKTLENLPNEKIQELVQNHSVFARIRPEQKYMIVEALQANNEVVAMTGDGVNDAPALKKATIGIAMGKKGTEVARAAAGIVLLDDNFTTIVHAVEEGRRMYDNLRKAFLFLFSFQIPIAGLAIIPLLLGEQFYFLPIHIIFLELFSDPITVLGLERDLLRRGAMTEKPRPVSEPLINSSLWWQIGWQAAGILGIALLFYGYGLWFGGLVVGRTMSFAALVVSQVILVLINRDFAIVKQNILLLVMLSFTVVMLHIILFVPVVRMLFHFAPLSLNEYLYVLIGAAVTMLYFNKVAQRK